MAGVVRDKETQPPHPVELKEHYMNDHAPSLLKFKEMKCRAEAEALQCRLNLMEDRYTQLR